MVRPNSSGIGTSEAGSLDPALHDAITDLNVYALMLEAEWIRLGERIAEMAADCSSADEGRQLTELRAQMGEELEALRDTATALRDHAPTHAAGATGAERLPEVPAR
jgi:hypothetical protein